MSGLMEPLLDGRWAYPTNCYEERFVVSKPSMMETMAMQIWMPMKPETEPEKTDDDMQERKKPVKNEPETETEDDMPTLIPVEPALIPVEPAAPRGRTLKCKPPPRREALEPANAMKVMKPKTVMKTAMSQKTAMKRMKKKIVMKAVIKKKAVMKGMSILDHLNDDLKKKKAAMKARRKKQA